MVKNELKETHESSTDYSDNIGEETAESEYEAQEEKEEDTLEL